MRAEELQQLHVSLKVVEGTCHISDSSLTSAKIYIYINKIMRQKENVSVSQPLYVHIHAQVNYYRCKKEVLQVILYLL